MGFLHNWAVLTARLIGLFVLAFFGVCFYLIMTR
jgi:hypothetical protein